MKYASDFRRIARDSLGGKWMTAVIAGLIAALLGGIASDNAGFKINIDSSGVSANFLIAGQTIYSTASGISSQIGAFLTGSAVVILLVALIIAAAYYILGSVIEVGYARFNLDLVDRKEEAELSTLFGCFSYWRTTAAAKFLRDLYVFLWSLLLIIPGIVAGFSYAMTSYILAEHPDLTAGEAIERSREMMSGNRWRLFCLRISFIGWDILCSLTLGIGNLWLRPYRQAAEAAFYREVSGTERVVNNADPQFI